MKTFKITLVLFLGMFTFQSQAQVVEEKIWVDGICDMCKDRIEKALDTRGVLYANYTVENNELAIAYNTKKLSNEEIHKILNEVGHDTKKSKASDEQYATVHSCCKYRTGSKHGDGSCGHEKKDACCEKKGEGDSKEAGKDEK